MECGVTAGTRVLFQVGEETVHRFCTKEVAPSRGPGVPDQLKMTAQAGFGSPCAVLRSG